MVRFDADGTRDESFGSSGIVTIDFGSGRTNPEYGRTVAIDTAGRIVVAGESGNNFAVARFDANGQLDSTFDGDGKQTIDFGGSDRAFDLAIDSEGRIVIAGDSQNDFAVARLDVNGQLDSTFDGDGKKTIDFSGGSDAARALAIDSAGRIVLAGNSPDDFAVARLDANGQLDSTFDGDGKKTIDFSGGSDSARALAIDSAGRIVLAGDSPDDFAVARLDTNGQLDSTFDGDGKKTIDFSGGSDSAYGVAIDSDGRIVLAGIRLERLRGRAARYKWSARLHLRRRWQTDRQLRHQRIRRQRTSPALLIDSAGRIVLGGEFDNYTWDPPYWDYDLGLARLLGDWTPCPDSSAVDPTRSARERTPSWTLPAHSTRTPKLPSPTTGISTTTDSMTTPPESDPPSTLRPSTAPQPSPSVFASQAKPVTRSSTPQPSSSRTSPRSLPSPTRLTDPSRSARLSRWPAASQTPPRSTRTPPPGPGATGRRRPA